MHARVLAEGCEAVLHRGDGLQGSVTRAAHGEVAVPRAGTGTGCALLCAGVLPTPWGRVLWAAAR